MTEITLPFPPSANNLFAGTTRRHISKRYAAWRTTAGWELRAQKARPVTGQVGIEVTLTPPDRRRRDASNFLKAIEDLLVSHRIIADDGQQVVRRVSAQWTEPGAPLARVTITPA